MAENEYYDWNNLIDEESRLRMVADIDTVIANGDYLELFCLYAT